MVTVVRMLPNAYNLSCIFLILLLGYGRYTSAVLPQCIIAVTKRSTANTTCNSRRIQAAVKRHHITLLGPEKPFQPILLRCPICFEKDEKDFVWKFVPRSTGPPLFRLAKDSAYDSYWTLDENKLMDVPTQSGENPCVYPNSNDLHIVVRDLGKQIGTYVCSYAKNKAHPANFIWYHVDQIVSHRTNSRAVSFKFLSGLPNRVESLEQLQIVQSRVRKELEKYQSWNDQTAGPFVMTSIMSEEDVYLDGCGPLTIRQERRCFIGIPVEEPPTYEQEDYALIYRSLRDAFDFLVSFRDPTGLPSERLAQSARKKAKQLGFPIHGNSSYLFIPCEFSLYRHLFRFGERFREFPRPGYHVDVNYDVICPTLSTHDLTELINITTLKNTTFSLPSIEDLRYIKVQRLIIEGERHLSLTCSSKIEKPLQCDGPYPDVLWRSANDLTFGPKRKASENVYVTKNCELRFDEVHTYDMDIYYCFLRNPKETNIVWSQRPRIAYRLRIERIKFSWPHKSNVLVGLVVLFIWSLILSTLWVALNIYDASVREGAVFEATVKQAGGRMARLKKTYSPFSDEDRGLFFRLMQNDYGERNRKK
ncbi:unnamed protein product [Echinostoma caproni]|uniref:Ig-like domain-containing protein n=1 Tax=Echinostoma caproni TaxID=27848 RepID=A0A183B5U7_9TREM|nr:unnamed protein product [Echinostoma caproni]